MSATNKGPNPKPAYDPRAMIALARVNWLHSKYNIVGIFFKIPLILYSLTEFLVKRGFSLYAKLIRIGTQGKDLFFIGTATN
jgi:hypothetical protein